MIFVLLSPSTVEDKGRYHYEGAFGSERQADLYIEEQVKKSKGWYSLGSFIKVKKI